MAEVSGNGVETAKLGERVGSLEANQAEMRGDIKAGAKTNPQTLIGIASVALLVAGLLGGIFTAFLNAQSDRLTGQIDILSKAHEDLKTFVDANIVTRSEHAAVREVETALRQGLVERIDQLRSEVNVLKDAVGATYGTRDVIVDLKAEIARLREKIEKGGP